MKHDLPFGMRFGIISRTCKHNMDERLQQLGLTGVQLGVLKELEHLENSDQPEVNQRDLENAVHVTHPTMTEILKRLERAGYISCCQSTVDRRHKCIVSTEKTRELHQQMVDMDKEFTAYITRGISPEQLEQLYEITDIMLDNAFECRKGSEEIDKKACKKRQGI
jgi:DNA-binding MarR family transcriptional regulator